MAKCFTDDMHFPSPPFNRGDAIDEPGLSENAFEELGTRLTTLEGELRRDGWETVTTAAPQMEVVVKGDPREVWIVHEAPNDQTATVVQALQDGKVISTCTHQQRRDGRLFELLLLLNPGLEYAILLPTIVETEQVPTSPSGGDNGIQLFLIVRRSTGEQIGAVQYSPSDLLLPDSG